MKYIVLLHWFFCFPTTISISLFMHCLPIRRNVVASDAVLDGPRSRVLVQARNRMLAQQAVLHRLLA